MPLNYYSFNIICNEKDPVLVTFHHDELRLKYSSAFVPLGKLKIALIRLSPRLNTARFLSLCSHYQDEAIGPA
jgi:hypothetical protein